MTKNTMMKRFTAVLLVLVMAVSVAATAVTSASAAEISNSISMNSIAKDIASGYAKEIIDATAGANPVTKVLGSVGLDLFNRMLNGSESKPVSTDAIMAQVNALSDKMDTYHAQEMTALTTLGKKMDLLANKMDLLAFTNKCDEMRSSYVHTLSKIDDNAYKITTNSMTEGTKDADVFVIDDSTYNAYQKILNNIDTDTQLDKDFLMMYSYLCGSSTASYNERCYEHLIDGYVLLQQSKIGEGAAFKDIPDLSEVQEEISGLEADNVLYYAAYMTVIQMKYQCENHEAYVAYLNSPQAEDDEARFTPADQGDSLNQIQKLNGRMDAMDRMYQQACASYDNLDSAQVTLDPASNASVTKDFADIDLAWSTAVRTVAGTDSARFTLLQDWKADSSGSLNPDKALCSAGFNGNGKLTANLSGGDLTICLNQHDIDMRDAINDTLLSVTGNHTLAVYGYNGEKPDDAYLFGGALRGGKQCIVYNASASGARLVMKNVTVYEPYDNMVEFHGKDKNLDSVSISGCFLNNTHKVYEKSEVYRLYFSNCSVNMNNCAVRTVSKDSRAIKLDNAGTTSLTDIRYYGPYDFIIV